MADLQNERFYPASADEVFEALHAAVYQLCRVKGADSFSRSIAFSTPMSGFSWGASMSAQVLPVQGGAYVRVGGAAHVRTNVTAKGAEFRNVTKILDAVSWHIQNNRTKGTGLPPAGWYPAPDPEHEGQLRWWDGAAWTEHRAPG